MKPFFFRLESVLHLRAREEQRARDLSEHAEAVRHRAERDLHEGQAELARREKALATMRTGRMTLHDHQIYMNSIALQRVGCEKLGLHLRAAAQEADRLRQELLLAHRKHRAVQHLKDRHRCAHEAAEARKQEQAVNDLITSRHALAAHAHSA